MDEQGMEEGDRSKKNIEPAFAKAMAGRAPNQPSLKLRRARRSTSNVERYLLLPKNRNYLLYKLDYYK